LKYFIYFEPIAFGNNIVPIFVSMLSNIAPYASTFTDIKDGIGIWPNVLINVKHYFPAAIAEFNGLRSWSVQYVFATIISKWATLRAKQSAQSSAVMPSGFPALMR
jgi:hypothetical protein